MTPSPGRARRLRFGSPPASWAIGRGVTRVPTRTAPAGAAGRSAWARESLGGETLGSAFGPSRQATGFVRPAPRDSAYATHADTMKTGGATTRPDRNA